MTRRYAMKAPPDAPIRVLAALTEAAESEAPCPTNDELALRLELGATIVPHIVARLRDLGRILVEQMGNRRRITIVATGKRTAMSLSVGCAADRVLPPERKIDYDTADRAFSAAMQEIGGRFENAMTVRETLNQMPRLPPLNHTPFGCALR